MIEAALATYSFPTGEPERPALIAVPVSILEQILSEVQALRDQVALQGEEIQDLRDHTASQDAELATLKLQVNALEANQELEVERLALDIASDRRRISKLEIPLEPDQKARSSKVERHLNAICDSLQTRERQCKATGQKHDFMAYWEVEELLGLSHRRVSQLADIAKNDPRFVIGWHPRKKNMKVFRLNPFEFGRVAAELQKSFKANT